MKWPHLSRFSLDIPPGQKVALVGASGAGKSTVTSLLLRLYEVETGRILLDGTDIRDLTQEALRSQISVVRQETAMFNRSAFDNIRYGCPEASAEEVFDAARRASADDFITALKDFRGREGYDAFLGERGVKLSGGQRQRIALARAILKDAPLLVLDEATSALDSEVEADIQSALKNRYGRQDGHRHRAPAVHDCRNGPCRCPERWPDCRRRLPSGALGGRRRLRQPLGPPIRWLFD